MCRTSGCSTQAIREARHEPAEHEKQECKATAVQKTLREAAFAAAWAQGRAMTLEQAVIYALEEMKDVEQ